MTPTTQFWTRSPTKIKLRKPRFIIVIIVFPILLSKGFNHSDHPYSSIREPSIERNHSPAGMRFLGKPQTPIVVNTKKHAEVPVKVNSWLDKGVTPLLEALKFHDDVFPQ